MKYGVIVAVILVIAVGIYASKKRKINSNLL